MKRCVALFLFVSLLLCGCSAQVVPGGELRLFPETDSAAAAASGLPLLITDEHPPYMEASASGNFMPEALMRRGEICDILYRLMANPIEGRCSFSDIFPSSRYYEAVSCLAGWGIVTDSAGTFRPNDLISWAELLTMLSRFYPAPQDGDEPYVGSFLGHRGNLTAAEMLPELVSFAGTQGHWASAAIENAAARGWLDTGEEFNPDAAVTRADFCRLMNRVLGRQADLAMALLADDAPVFEDVPSSHPDYADVLEACCTHEYRINDEGYERWIDDELEPGVHRLQGQLFYVQENGELLRSGSVGVLNFDEYGRYTCGVPETDAAVTKILLSLGTDSMTRLEALRACYRYCTKDKEYIRHTTASYGFPEGSSTQIRHAYRALKFFRSGGGVCYDFAAAFGMLARALGYSKAYIVFAEVNEYHAPHGWVIIPEGDTDYIYDPELEATRPERHSGTDLFRIKNHSIYHYWYTGWW